MLLVGLCCIGWYVCCTRIGFETTEQVYKTRPMHCAVSYSSRLQLSLSCLSVWRLNSWVITANNNDKTSNHLVRQSSHSLQKLFRTFCWMVGTAEHSSDKQNKGNRNITPLKITKLSQELFNRLTIRGTISWFSQMVHTEWWCVIVVLIQDRYLMINTEETNKSNSAVMHCTIQWRVI